MKLNRKKQSILITVLFSLSFGAAMTFWGLGKYSEDKLIPFLLYTILFGILHRMLSSRWK